MKHILVDHGAHRNVGDAAMLESVLSSLRTRYPDANVYVRDCPLELDSADTPAIARKGYSVCLPGRSSIPDGRRHTIRSILSLARLGRWLHVGRLWVDAGNDSAPLVDWARGYDALLVTGGGSITDVFPNELWQRLALVEHFASTGRPVVLTGQQIGPFTRAASRAAALRVLRGASYLGLRDPGTSAAMLRKAGLSQFSVDGDDSFGIQPAAADRVLEKLGLAGRRLLVANFRFGYYTSSYRRYAKKVAEVLSDLATRHDAAVLLVPIALGGIDSDIETARILVPLIQAGAVRVLPTEDCRPSIVKGVLSRAVGGIGNSYHFCLFCLQGGTPAILLHDNEYYRQKADAIAQLWEDPRLTLSLSRSRGEIVQAAATLFADSAADDSIVLRSRELEVDWRRGIGLALDRLSQ
ncbi:MAG: polysaccharide pyruvyl transferase family protein [Bacteroidetes bacterium]|nr:polysaccharide pyruvyl transferase family protein [Bacteroidota bacterium]